MTIWEWIWHYDTPDWVTACASVLVGVTGVIILMSTVHFLAIGLWYVPLTGYVLAVASVVAKIVRAYNKRNDN